MITNVELVMPEEYVSGFFSHGRITSRVSNCERIFGEQNIAVAGHRTVKRGGVDRCNLLLIRVQRRDLFLHCPGGVVL